MVSIKFWHIVFLYVTHPSGYGEQLAKLDVHVKILQDKNISPLFES